MCDTPARPDFSRVFDFASAQLGHVMVAQLRICGYGTDAVAHARRAGRLIRVHPGVYRLRDYPSSPHEATMAAWLALDPAQTVVSHESALELLDLADVSPGVIHLTLPRARRSRRPPPGVVLHTTTRPFAPGEIVVREGMRLTSAVRTIVDVAETGLGPEQVERAIRQALARGLATPDGLAAASGGRGRRVGNLIDGATRRFAA